MFDIFERKLLKSIPLYESEGILDAENAKRLRAHIIAKISKPQNIFLSALYILGIFLIASAVMLLLSHKWDDIPSQMRLVLAFAPLLISGIIGYFSLAKKTSWLWGECSASINIFGLALLLSIAGSEYNAMANPCDFLRAVLILSMPAMFIFNSGISAAALSIISVAAVDPSKDALLYSLLCSNIALAVIILFAYKECSKTNPWLKSIALFTAMSCALWVNAWNLPLIAHEQVCYGFRIMTLAAMSAVIFPLASFKCLKFPLRFSSFALGAILIIIVFSACNYSGYSLKEMLSSAYPKSLIENPRFYIYISIFSLLALLEFAGIAKKKDWPYALSTAMFALTVFSALFINNSTYLEIYANAIMLLAALLFFIKGLKLKSYFFMNLALAVLIWQGLIRILGTSSDIYIRSSFCAAIGLCVIIFNVALKKIMDRSKMPENSQDNGGV